MERPTNDKGKVSFKVAGHIHARLRRSCLSLSGQLSFTHVRDYVSVTYSVKGNCPRNDDPIPRGTLRFRALRLVSQHPPSEFAFQERIQLFCCVCHGMRMPCPMSTRNENRAGSCLARAVRKRNVSLVDTRYQEGSLARHFEIRRSESMFAPIDGSVNLNPTYDESVGR